MPETQKLVLKIEDINKRETLVCLKHSQAKGSRAREAAEKRHNANPAFSLPPKEQWTEQQRDEFNAIAGEMMSFFGYD